jgi:hypothetical protein
MMQRPQHGLRPWLSLLLAAVLGCSVAPTYHREDLVDALQAVLKEDGVAASVRLLDHTIAVQFEYPGALLQDGEQIGIGPTFDDAARIVTTAIHRVLLSSDADVRFYVMLLSDPAIPGTYLTIVRYLDDIRRAHVNMLDVTEMMARTIFELNTVGSNVVTLEQYLPRDIELPEFLSWQLARRIQRQLAEELELSGMAAVGRCGGEFHDGEFAFTLNVVPTVAGAIDEPTIRQIFQSATKVIAQVLSSYRFESFTSVRLIHPATGRHIVLPRTNLSVFR